MKKIITLLTLALSLQIGSAQNFNGFALYNSQGSSTTYLIDENQNIAHTWNMTTECNYTVALKENGNLVRGTKYNNTSVFSSGNIGWQSGHHTIPSNCTSFTGSPTSVINIDRTLDRILVEILDFSGKKTSEKYNIPLFYIYKNGDVDRNLIVQ